MFAVFVTIKVKQDDQAAFALRVKQQAEESLAKEPGCEAFEVWTNESDPTCVQLYEVYRDADAFHKEHLKTAHYENFSAAVAPMIEDKTVLTFDGRL